ncbi:DUF2683 domain-containing protein [Candidatus Woesearchaeota archaeon]|nr:MAG: DUF2683 domain-containing protein [Candidatus Woesearchaeota archaeon]
MKYTKRKIISARIQLTEPSNKVLNVVKAQYGLKDKSEAINKLIELAADDFIDTEPTDAYVKKILAIDAKHMKKYGNKTMTLEELDKLCGL